MESNALCYKTLNITSYSLRSRDRIQPKEFQDDRYRGMFCATHELQHEVSSSKSTKGKGVDVSFEVWPTKIKKLGKLELHLYQNFWAVGL